MIPAELPALTKEEALHSARLITHIRTELEAADGWLPFDRFMSLALYAPGLGYYAAAARPFGQAGDYTTAPELSPVFGRCLATSLADVLAAVPSAEVLEVGAGSGRLAVDLLTELERIDCLPARYRILEVSGALREVQAQTFRRELFDCETRIDWLDRLPDQPWSGVVIANEVADALPVERFQVSHDGLASLGVGWVDDRFQWLPGPASGTLERAVEGIEDALGRALPAPYVSELAPSAGAWVQALAARLRQGAVYVIDYGLPRCEYYAPGRAHGSLACFFRHRVHGDPFINVGLQDLTAWVDFTSLASAGHDAGLNVAGFTTQAHFLLACGFDKHVAAVIERESAVERQALTQAAASLVLPGEMGEKFKCLALTREVAIPRGFALKDLSVRL